MKTIVRWNPQRNLSNIQNEFDRLMDSFFTPPVLGNVANANWGLALDVAEDATHYTITAALPGVKGDELEITLDKDVRYHLRERRYGSFSRSIRLPENVNAEAIEASHENGIVTIAIPKAEAVKPKRINVNGQKAIEGETQAA
ncbi:MAG: Hsp20/alpha crystallin family protein [Chloroflexi bacterium]|nr:Hsp20/alpha crystallin family protein [Chloroflexota bacterium]